MVFRCGVAPFLECSSKGDKRFSAFFARINKRGGFSIEEIYQAAKVFENGQTGLTWRDAKGRKPVNVDEVTKLYAQLWDEYIKENPDLLPVIQQATGLSDIFGQAKDNCQSRELWRIRCKSLGIDPGFTTEEMHTEIYRSPTIDVTPYELPKKISAVVKDYVCGFIFSFDWSNVYLIKKNRPQWQFGKLNGIGGKVENAETPVQAMIRVSLEEAGIEILDNKWTMLERFVHSNGVRVSFFTACLDKGQAAPCSKTDEEIVEVLWKSLNFFDWETLGAIDNLPYLINKAACFIHAPKNKRMELQNQQDIR